MKFSVNLGVHSYDVILKRGCLQNAYQFIHLGRKVAVITDDGVPAQYPQQLADQCADCRIITVPQGQNHRDMATLETILRQMMAFGMTKNDLVIAVGGSTVISLAGMAASIYQQGIDFVNCPTTTQAMTAQSIGGMVSIDVDRTRDVVGVPYQPRLVLVDPDTLETLPRRRYVSGLTEAVKLGLCFDPALFAILENDDIDAEIETILQRCLIVHRALTENTANRRALRFGHTIGEAIEALKGNWGRRTTGLYHGECIGLGLLPMIESRSLQKRTRAVLRRLGLPTRCNYDKDVLMQEVLRQSAAQGRPLSMIFVPGLGCWRPDGTGENTLRNILFSK